MLSRNNGASRASFLRTFLLHTYHEKPLTLEDYQFLGMLYQKYPDLLVRLWSAVQDDLTPPDQSGLHAIYRRCLYFLNELVISVYNRRCKPDQPHKKNDYAKPEELTGTEKVAQPDILKTFLQTKDEIPFCNVLYSKATSTESVPGQASKVIDLTENSGKDNEDVYK